jgi:hypothetical protein
MLLTQSEHSALGKPVVWAELIVATSSAVAMVWRRMLLYICGKRSGWWWMEGGKDEKTK